MGPAGMANPTGITADRAGMVYVTDHQDSGHVWKFTDNGKYVADWVVEGTKPTGIDVTAQGVVYVIDDEKVQSYTREGVLKEILVTVGGPDVAVSPGGDVYVVNVVEKQVDRYTAAGTLVTWEAAFDDPRGVAVAPNGDVYVTDLVEKSVSRLSEADAFNRTWAGDDHLVSPTGLTVDTAGYVYVVDYVTVDHHRVRKFTNRGDLVGTIGDHAFKEAVDITVSRTGMVYVTDREDQSIIQYTPA